jgi:tetratricopeptide (TPR) repeat protein
MNTKNDSAIMHATIAGLALASCLGLLVSQPDAAHAKRHGHAVMRGRIERDVAMADQLTAKGKFEQAEDLYRQAINRNPKNPVALVGYGMLLGKEFKLDAASDQFDKALALDPQNAMAHAGKAIVLVNRLQSSNMTVQKNKISSLQQAENECNQALQLDPQMQEAHYARGLVYREQKRFDDAAREFQAAIQSDPKYSDAYAGLGMTKLAQGNVPEAMSNFQQAIKLTSSNSSAHFGLGRAYLQQGQVDNAIKELNISLYQFRNSAPVHLALGDAYQVQGNNVAAVKEYQESIRIKPENPAPYLHIADIREARGDIEHAIAECRSGLELSDSPELRLRIGDDSLRLEKIDDAIKEYEQVLSAAPGSQRAVNGLTTAYYLKAQKETTGAFVGSNDFERAEDSIKRAISMHPDDLQLRLALAKMQALSGQTVDLGAVGNPTNDAERLALAQACLAQNNFAEATNQMSQVIAHTADAKQTFSVADMSLMIKDLDSAEAAYKKASTFPGAEARARRGLAQVAKAREGARQETTLASDLAMRKQLASAIDKYHSAIFENPRVSASRIGLAKTLEKVSKPAPKELREAATQYKAYLALEPSLPVKEHDKVLKHAVKLEERAYKLEQKQRPVVGAAVPN